MGWTKREEALSYLKEKRDYHHTFAWLNAAQAVDGTPNAAGRHHFKAYMSLCGMLATVPDGAIEQMYGEEKDEIYSRDTSMSRGGRISS